MFPALPADLSALTDEELSALHDQFRDAGRTLLAAARHRDAAVLGERTQDDVDTELTAAAEALTAIRAEQDSRKADEQEFDASLSTHAQTFGVDESEETAGEGETDAGTEGDDETQTPTETEGETTEPPGETTETEAQTASARTRTRRPIPLASARHTAVAPDVDATGFRSQIRSDAIKVSYGDQISDRSMMGEILNHVVKRNVVSPGGSVIVASATIPFDDGRILGKREDESVRKIQRLQQDIKQPEALTASGALCAPLEPLYDIFGVSTAARPVRDALPSFQASRGGVITRAAPSMGVYADAVGEISAEDNASGGSLAVKNCMRLICPEPTSVEVSSIYRCTEADNLASKSDPELMAAVDELVRAEHGRLADSFLLDQIKLGSTEVAGTTGTDGGATVNLLADAFKAAAGYRSRHRMALNAPLTGIASGWVVDLIALDLAKAAFKTGVEPVSRDAVEARLRGLLAQAGIRISFTLDGTSDADDGQIFGPQTDSAILDFPDTLEWSLFAPGTWLHLDSGTLDLGVVRDSILNSTNDFQVFAEGWENVAFVGIESLVITTNVCPSGTFAAGVDLSAVC